MSITGALEILAYLLILLALVRPLGGYMARVYQNRRTFLDPVLGPVERLIYRVAGIQADEEMDWRTYAGTMLLFNGLGVLALYILQRCQSILPLNPQSMGPVAPDLALNTSVSFVTNTDWPGGVTPVEPVRSGTVVSPVT